MAYSDTIASRLGFTQFEASDFMAKNWEVFSPYLEDVDETNHKQTYAKIANKITSMGGVENCGGFQSLAGEFAVSEKLVRIIFDDLLEIAALYKSTL